MQFTFRNTTIEKWYQRTKLGSAVKGKKAGYTALEQAPLKQIEHILAEQDRLLQRTRIKRSQYSIVGLPNLKQVHWWFKNFNLIINIIIIKPRRKVKITKYLLCIRYTK